MVWLKKKSAGSAPGYIWEHDGQVLDVDDELAQELLERPGGEFTEAEPPESDGEESTEVTEPEPDDADEEPAGGEGAAEAKKPGRRRTKVSE